MKKIVYIAVILVIQHLTLNIQNSFGQSPNDNRGSGNCLSFDGVNDYVSVPDDPAWDFGANNFTIEFWYKGNDAAPFGSPGIISRRGVAPVWPAFTIVYSGPPEKVAFFATTSTGWDIVSGLNMGAYSLTEWHHFAVTRSGTTFTGYRDGVQIATATSGLALKSDAGNNMIFGNYWTNYGKQFLDEVRIWNVARTSAQIRDNMCIQLQGNESNLVGYWNMNEGTGNTVGDLTSNNNDGTRQ